MESMLYVDCIIFALCSLTSLECWYVSHDVERGQINISMQNEVEKPTRLLQFVAFVHLPFSFRSLNLFEEDSTFVRALR